MSDDETYLLESAAGNGFRTPEWAKHAVWYQVMLDRFRNGDAGNDPEPLRPWRSEWFTPSPWEGRDGQSFYRGFVFQRRYGGDLAGLEEKLVYLKDLGVNALYLNPVFQARSHHKYDATSFLHIDEHFGPGPVGGVGGYAAAEAGEDLLDPSTWTWTESDRRFLDFLAVARGQGFRVVIDGVFNHVGTQHPAFRDVRAKGEASRFAGWFDVRSWEPFEYEGWHGFRGLPAFRKSADGLASESLKAHLFAVTRRWMAPDGDPGAGVDGWRLDVANEIPKGFWAEWRALVKSIRPDAYLSGEIWQRADEWLDGSTFDAVMNYPVAAIALEWIGNQLYGLDFGSRGLQPLAPLPHVGSIVPGDDAERVQRLLRTLEAMMDDRATRFAEAEAATIAEYRARAGRPHEPRILLLVDGLGAFRTEYEGGLLTRWWELFLRIAAEGRALGIHVVLSADRPSSVPSNLASSVQRELVLRLATEMDYAMADVPADAYGPGTPVGRGFMDGRQVQVGVVGGTRDLAEQGAAIARCAVAMERGGVEPATPVGALPGRVALSELTSTGTDPVIGVGDDDLAAARFATDGVFLVGGAPQSGRSTAVATMVRSIAAARPATEFVLFGQRRSPLASVAPWAAAAHGVTEIERLATKLADRLADAADSPLVVVIEAVGELLDTEADLPLQDVLRVCREHGVFVIAEGETSSVAGSWPLLQAIKSSRAGIVLQPDQMDGDSLFKTPFPRTTRPEFPVGRGLMVQGGRVAKVQVALPE